MSMYYVIFLFLLTFCTRNVFQYEGKLLRVRLIITELPNFNFSIQDINKYW